MGGSYVGNSQANGLLVLASCWRLQFCEQRHAGVGCVGGGRVVCGGVRTLCSSAGDLGVGLGLGIFGKGKVEEWKEEESQLRRPSGGS